MNPHPTARALRTLARALLLAAGLAAAGLLLRAVGAAPGTAWVDRHVLGQGAWGQTVFVLAGAAFTAVGAPRQAVAFLGGYGFGTVLGAALALLAQLGGAAAALLWARAVGGEWVERRLAGRFGPRLRPLVGALRREPFAATLALRLAPVGSNVALNLVAGMARVAAAPFLLASALGYAPQTLVFALLGKGVRVDGAWQVGLSVALIALSAVLGARLLRRTRARARLDDPQDRA